MGTRVQNPALSLALHLLACAALAQLPTTIGKPVTVDRTTNALTAPAAAQLVTANPALTAADPGVTPAQLANCLLWLKAADLAGSHTDGQTVTTWTDASGTGHDGSRRGTPTYKQNALNGHPAVHFDGTSADFTTTLATDATFNESLTVIAVTIPSGSGAYAGSTAAPGSGDFFFAHDATSIQNWLGVNGNAGGLVATPYGQPTVDILRYDGIAGTAKVRNNGLDLAPTPANQNIAPAGNWVVGSDGRHLGAGWNFPGDILEFAVFNRALTGAEVLSIEAGIRARLGVLTKPRIVLLYDSLGIVHGTNTTVPQTLSVGFLGSSYNYDAASIAQGGLSIAAASTAYAPAIKSSFRSGENVVVDIELGCNDCSAGISGATTWAAEKAMCLDLREGAGLVGANLRIVLHTPTPKTGLGAGQSAYDTARNDLIALQRAHYTEVADALADIAASSLIGTSTSSDDTTYYQPDKVHWKDAANSTAAPIIASALATALNGFLPIAVWRNLQFGANAGNADISGDFVDVDKDGLVNLMEYATGKNPNAFNAGDVPQGVIEGAYLTMTYTRAKAATDITLRSVWSTGLSGWSTVGITEDILADDGTIQTVKAKVLIAPDVKKFLRLECTRP